MENIAILPTLEFNGLKPYLAGTEFHPFHACAGIGITPHPLEEGLLFSLVGFEHEVDKEVPTQVFFWMYPMDAMDLRLSIQKRLKALGPEPFLDSYLPDLTASIAEKAKERLFDIDRVGIHFCLGKGEETYLVFRSGTMPKSIRCDMKPMELVWFSMALSKAIKDFEEANGPPKLVALHDGSQAEKLRKDPYLP